MKLTKTLTFATLLLASLLVMRPDPVAFAQQVLATIQKVTLVDLSGNAITPSADATTNTASQTTGPQIFCNASTATPTAVGADGRSIASWCGPNGQSFVNLWGVGGSAIATGHGTASGSIRVELPTDGTGVVGLNAGSASIGTVQPGNTANTTPWLVQTVPGTANGLTTFVLEAAASDNHTNVKNGAGVVYHITSFNNSATINYYRLYNAATGFNGCNSATNLLWEGLIPASTSGGGFVEDISAGLTFSTGISICITGAFGNTSTTSATASAILFDLGYK